MSVVQLCVVVPNLKEAVVFYQGTLGKIVPVEVLVPPTGVLSGEELSAQVGIPNARAELAFLRVGGTLFELTEYANPSTADEPDLLYHMPSAIIPGIAVDDLEAARAVLESEGIEFLSATNEVPEVSVPVFNATKWVRFYVPGMGQMELVQKV